METGDRNHHFFQRIGGAGGDGFVIARNASGQEPDRITDFEPGIDLVMIDLASFGIDPVALKLSSSGTLGSDSFVKAVGARALDSDDYFLFYKLQIRN